MRHAPFAVSLRTFNQTLRLAAVLAVMGLVSTAQAQWTWTGSAWDTGSGTVATANLADIVDTSTPPSLRVGDKVFDGFESLTISGATATDIFHGGGLGYDDDDVRNSIEVYGYFDINGEPGLLFESNLWVTNDLFATANNALNIGFEFVVTADPGFQIIGARMIIDDATITQGTTANDDLVNIVENVFTNPGNSLLAELNVQAPTILGLGSPIDIGPFSAQQSVRVVKDISLIPGVVDGGVVELNRFAQSFQQIPEPGTLALAGAGLALIASKRRRAGR